MTIFVLDALGLLFVLLLVVTALRRPPRSFTFLLDHQPDHADWYSGYDVMLDGRVYRVKSYDPSELSMTLMAKPEWHEKPQS